MVYSNKFVVAVLVNSQPQKELANGVVPLPFGVDYTLRFRNKHNRRAVVKFTLDGENVSGEGYIIPANSSVDIKRHYNKDVGFRFVDLESPEAVDHGKNGPNTDGSKGVIEAKFYLEKEHKVYDVRCNGYQNYPSPPPPLKYDDSFKQGPPSGQNAPSGSDMLRKIERATKKSRIKDDNLKTCTISTSTSFTDSIPISESYTSSNENLMEGVTVEGSTTGQRFIQTWIDLEEDFVMIRVVLKGYEPGIEVVENNQETMYCTNCGAKIGRKSDNFCGACGKRLYTF